MVEKKNGATAAAFSQRQLWLLAGDGLAASTVLALAVIPIKGKISRFSLISNS